jgi:hypothetical protein
VTELAGVEVGADPYTLEHLDFDYEAACEIPERARQIKGGTPMCNGNPAEWVGWRANCCPTSPRYLLICSPCKRVYQAWIATAGYITCGDCGAETGGFISFTELNRKS